MRIIKSSVALDGDYSNILVKDYAKNYPALDRMSTPGEVVQVMNDVFHLADRAEEYIYLICMTSRCRPIRFFEVAHGTCNMANAGIREILVRVLLCGAAGFILVHNHPSGEPGPSKEDAALTERLRSASGLVGVTCSDHIIIARGGYYSFGEQGRMED